MDAKRHIPQHPPVKIPVGWIVLGVAIALFAGFFYWLGQRANEPRITAKDKAQLEEFNRTGKVSGLDEEVNRNIAKFQRQQGIIPVPVAVPNIRSDFKAEYRETASAKGKIDVKISPTNDPRVVTIRIENKTAQPLLIKQTTEGRDAFGKVIYSSGEEGWYKMDPHYIINDTESPGGKEGIVAKTFWIEVKNAE